ncbi:transposase [Psychroserpens sp. NJDZ02]|uniref:transposase n=1 Tax=Psychroserpens sp. NJDZ02 TaxID=2570561 RepID=UPI0010A8DFCE|nr:transposase [Psychroserpens sp. NJDZ02]
MYYGNCGQKSLDPVVFFKCCLVGYLENITSDRKLLSYRNIVYDYRAEYLRNITRVDSKKESYMKGKRKSR